MTDHKLQLDNEWRLRCICQEICEMKELGCGILSLGLLAATAFAQSSASGTINVTVLDPTGATIPNASLELRDTGTNEVRRATTQQTGGYTFPNLSFGVYRLAIAAAGFQPQV